MTDDQHLEALAEERLKIASEWIASVIETLPDNVVLIRLQLIYDDGMALQASGEAVHKPKAAKRQRRK